MHSDKKIKKCFMDLLAAKSFDRVTVTEICNVSKVSRRTFYNHFDDMYDLLYTVLRDLAGDMIKSGKTKKCDPLKEATWEAALGAALEYFRTNRSIINSVYNSDSWEIVKDRIMEEVESKLLEAVQGASERTGVRLTSIDQDFLSGFYSSVFMAIVEKYIRHGMPDDTKWIVSYISRLLDPSFDDAVKALADRGK